MRALWERSSRRRTPSRRYRSYVACAIYTRQSVARPDEEDFSSCEAQRLACLQFLASRLPDLWLPMGGYFDDVGVSGATLDRPGILALLDRLEEGDIERVLVHRFDRLTRNFRDWLTLHHLFEQHSVRLTVVSGDLQMGEVAQSDMVLNTLATFAEFERELIGDRLRDARAARRQHGLRSAGRVPFGYRSDPRTRQLVPEPAEERAVREFFEKAAAGGLPAAIAAEANAVARDAAVPGSRGASWSARTVLRLLRNPVYVGDLGSGRDRVAGAHAPIVTREVFDAVQEVISRRQTRAPSARPGEENTEDPFLLRGLVTCSACGHRMTTSASRALAASTARQRRAGQDAPRYYRCRGARPCPGSQVVARALEKSVVRWLSAPPKGQLPDRLAERVGRLMSSWSVLWPVNRRRLLEAMIEELRWDGTTSTFTIVLNEDWLAHGQGQTAEG